MISIQKLIDLTKLITSKFKLIFRVIEDGNFILIYPCDKEIQNFNSHKIPKLRVSFRGV
jgi:hypothetical protein